LKFDNFSVAAELAFVLVSDFRKRRLAVIESGLLCGRSDAKLMNCHVSESY
jgi:hypothetical protein